MKFPERHRVKFSGQHPYYSREGDDFGVFEVPVGGLVMFCLVTTGDESIPWEHVSVTVRNRHGYEIRRTPTWEEMCVIKDTFWEPENAVIQFHPPHSLYVSQHKYCLHLWRKRGDNPELPPSIAVGTKKGQDI